MDNSEWQSEVDRLHTEAAKDNQHWQEQKDEDKRLGNDPDALIRMGKIYLSVNRQEGRLLYMLARSKRAKSIVEFGASYGISTLYLGAAAADNQASMVTSELHPDKCAATRNSLQRSGLSNIVSLLEGDGRKTLTTLDNGIDFVFLDGWKSHYLTVLDILRPKLEPGALVVADNIDHSAAKEYAEFIQSDKNWFTEVINKMSVSLLL
jgi:predicted O-methyltransferase YrrM